MSGPRTARRVVVTGAAGLIGRSVVRQLVARGDDVVAVIRPEAHPDAHSGAPSHPLSGAALPGASLFGIDLAARPEEALARIGAFDALIHLAQAPGWHAFPKSAGAVARINVAASVALAEAAVAAGAGCMVMASSGGIYGPSAVPIREDDPIRPGDELGCYLASKAAAESLLGCFRPYLPIHVLRPFFVYGPQQAASFIIPRLIRAVRTGAPVRTDGGTGPAMNPVWVEDAAQAFVAALDGDTPLTANIAGPDIVTVRDIATLIAARLGVSAIFDETALAPQNYVADTALMAQRLGAPETRFASGLSAMLASLSPES